MKEIKLGTIGSGVIVRSILDGVKATEGISLEAVYSRSAEKGARLAADYGAPKVYTELEALFRDEAVNFIYVASPNSLHYQQARAALEHGKNVTVSYTQLDVYRRQPQWCFPVSDAGAGRRASACR